MPNSDGYWSKVVESRHSRRRLLKAGGAGAITGAALASGLACSPKKASPTGGGTRSKGAYTPSTEQPKSGGRFAYATATTAPDLDPRLVLSIGLHGFLSSIMSRLVTTAKGVQAKDSYDFTIKPELAASWEQPQDLASITFKLNQGVKWHDIPPVSGRELTSADIKYTFDSYKASGAHTSAFDTLERVETPDPQTAKFVLNQPFGGFLEVLTVSTQDVIAHEVLEKYGDLKTVTVGTGPFMLEKFDRDVSWTAKKNPSYFKKGLPYLDGFEVPIVTDGATRYASFRSGKADMITVPDSATLKQIQGTNPDLQFQETREPRSAFGVMMQQDKPPYNDVRVRRAMSMAIDRSGMRKSLYQDQSTLGWGIPWFYWQEAEPADDQFGPYWKYNVAEAKKLMEAAGHKDGFKDTLSYFEYDTSMTSQVQVAQAQLKQNLNIDLEIKQMDYAAWYQWYTGHKWTGTAWGFQIGSSSTLDDFTYQNVLSDSIANYMYMKDDQIDGLAKAVRKEADVTRRKALVKQMVEREHDQAYRLWMPWRFAFYLMQPHVRGFRWMALIGGGCADYGGDERELHWSAKA